MVFYFFSLITITMAWWLLGISSYFGNQLGVFSTRAFLKSAILIPGIFIVLVLIAKYVVFPWLQETSKNERRVLLITSAVLALLTLYLFPLAQPAYSQQHSLQIISTGTKNSQAVGSIIEIRKLSYLDGSPVPLDELKLSGDWQVVGDTLISTGKKTTSVAEIVGKLPGGIVIHFRYNENAGEVIVVWDGDRSDIDLYAPQSISTDHVFRGETKNIPQILLKFVVQAFFFIGLFSIVLLIGFVVDVRWPNSSIIRVVLVLAYIAILALFVEAKFSYLEFSTSRIFFDTEWYVETANEPIDSLEFWAGTRPFTYPLVLKYFGITLDNFTDIDQYPDLVHFQYWFSIFAWTALAIALSFQVRKLWIRPFVLLFVLYFSLNFEISIWDGLILTESTSFSLFALLVATWLLWNSSSQKLSGHLIQIVYLFFSILFTVLYVFSRESNQYFVLMGSLVFLIISLFGKLSRQNRYYYIVYFLLFVGIIFGKNVAFGRSDLWQVHIFDHLAHRIIPDEQMREYFVSKGLPLSEDLTVITEMPGYEYIPYLLDDPEMTEFREWVQNHGLPTYFGYLISHPVQSMIEPFRHLPTLFSGDNLEYHQPLYAVPTVPLWLKTLTQRFYPRNLVVLFVFVGLSAFGVLRYLLDKNLMQSSWIVVAVLLVSLYPMMFIVWHGNPIEIERHAIPIGIQLRLMGWMTIILFLDQLACGELYPWQLGHKSHHVLES